ncbi:MAG: phosphoenolpyruvate--protein phosphotransferase [Lachnospiraceae bacterium]|nr:phosphoenolpyruvate--protein phosphotransferase [Lachnospiraceae bacterium]
MRIFKGTAVFSGIAIGTVSLYKKNESKVKRIHGEDAETEKERFTWAVEQACEQLGKLYDKALTEVGEASAAIFEAHQMMIEDDDYIESVEHIIESQKVNAEYAVACTSDNYASMFQAMDDEYMRGRAADVKDVSNRIINILKGEGMQVVEGDNSLIVVADDLAPSETVQMDKSKVISFVTRYGSSNSHTAILARTMNIPALIKVEFPEDIHGKTAIVDGYEGALIVEPDEEALEKYTKKRDEYMRRRKLLQELKGKENVTRDGRKIELYANIGGVSDAISALQNDAGGIGLFRSEFLYLGSDSYPTEDEQFGAYKSVAEAMAGKKVIIRTLDIGADKQADYFGLEREENPAMGFRAIRICLKRPEVFKTQLRAILRASMYGNISIMFPMIISVAEVRTIKAILAQVKDELKKDGIPYKDIEIGVMIETPAAALISDELAKEVDFFSIGTNDLTQYTLAIDRQNEQLAHIYDTHHPAVLRMIEMVVNNGHAHNCWVGICGELASDIELTKRFIDMGVDELSVSPAFILELREKIREL